MITKLRIMKIGMTILTLALFIGLANVSYAKNDKEKKEKKDNPRYALCERGEFWKKLKFCKEDNSNRPPLVYLFATKYSIKSGNETKLYWDAKRADSCSASGGWSGAKDTSDKEKVSPATTTTYTITCTNAFGSYSDSVEIYVKPPKDNGTTTPPSAPVLTFTGLPLKISDAASSTLTWSSSNTNYCIASNGWSGSKSLSGNQVVEPNATTTYTLSCGGLGGTTTQNVEIAVYPAPNEEEPAAPTLSFTTASSTLLLGATTTLDWTSSNTNYCLASNGWSGSQSLSSSTVVSPAVNTTYTLSCGGLGGTTTQNAIINVVTPPAPPALDHLIISEVYYDVGVGKGGEPGNEWIEIYNNTGSTIDLNHWSIADTSGSFDFIATTSTLLPSGSFVVITDATTTSGLWGDVPMLSIGTNLGNALGNASDAVYLRDVASTTVDAMSYGGDVNVFNPSSPDVASGHSLYRTSLSVDTNTAADWADLTLPTPGSQ